VRGVLDLSAIKPFLVAAYIEGLSKTKAVQSVKQHLAAIRMLFDFDPRMINKITVSQQMPDQVYSTIREHLRSAFTNPDQRINRSTIYQNRIWIAKFKNA
jgi:hypothetical protein